MVDITERLLALLGFETLKEKQEKEKRAAKAVNDVAKIEALM